MLEALEKQAKQGKTEENILPVKMHSGEREGTAPHHGARNPMHNISLNTENARN